MNTKEIRISSTISAYKCLKKELVYFIPVALFVFPIFAGVLGFLSLLQIIFPASIGLISMWFVMTSEVDKKHEVQIFLIGLMGLFLFLFSIYEFFKWV